MKLTKRGKPISRKRRTGTKGNKSSSKFTNGELSELAGGEEAIATIENAAGIILAVTENRNWIEVFFGVDLMHTKTINLPSGRMFNIYIEEIPHKTTVYEHPRTMIVFDAPCDLRITRDGDKVIVMGVNQKEVFI